MSDQPIHQQTEPGTGPHRLGPEPIVSASAWRPKAVLGGLVAALLCAWGVINWGGGGSGLVVVALVLLALWLGYLWAMSRTRLVTDGDVLRVRGVLHEQSIRGAEVDQVRYVYNGSSPNIRLLGTDGRAVLVPCSRLERGHSGLFTWLAAHAPQAHYDDKSIDVRDRLIIRGLMEG